MGQILNIECLGARVRSRREAAKMTQKELASVAGCTSTHISNIENHYTIPSIELIMKLCSIFQVSPDYLLLGIDRTDNEDDWPDFREKLLLCTPEQRRFFLKLLDQVVEENQTDAGK